MACMEGAATELGTEFGTEHHAPMLGATTDPDADPGRETMHGACTDEILGARDGACTEPGPDAGTDPGLEPGEYGLDERPDNGKDLPGEKPPPAGRSVSEVMRCSCGDNGLEERSVRGTDRPGEKPSPGGRSVSEVMRWSCDDTSGADAEPSPETHGARLGACAEPSTDTGKDSGLEPGIGEGDNDLDERPVSGNGCPGEKPPPPPGGKSGSEVMR